MPDARSLPSVAAKRGLRAYAAAHRRLTRVADTATVSAVARPGGSSLEAWHRSTSDRHEQYRRDRPMAGGSAGIVCVSSRPYHLASVIDTVARQRETSPQFVLVPNGPDWDRGVARSAVQALDDASVLWGVEDASLGEALNAGIAELDARFVAKVDDDDHYGPHYLADALRAHRYAGAGVIGKHSYYADVEGVDGRFLRFPGQEFAYASTLAGGTLVIDRDRVGDLRFDDVSLGEDRAFIHACHRRGVSTYSADRFSFLQHRGADNTWQLRTDQFLAGCIPVDSAASEHEVDR